MQSSVCAVIVTFNRLDLLKEEIQALVKQTRALDKIFIVNNNSSDGTKEYLEELKNSISNLHPIHLDENLGGAGGFYVGTKEAFDKGYDWIWIMDDDAEPELNCLEKLLETAENNDNVGFVAPLIIHKTTKVVQNYHHKRINESLTTDFPLSLEEIKGNKEISLDANAFVGPLISKKVIEKIGLPRSDFFIWLDDTEYTHRITRISKGILNTEAVIFHKDKDAVEDHVRNFWKVCYGFRNRMLWIQSSLKGFSLIASLLKMTMVYLKMVAKIYLQSRWKNNRFFVLSYLNKAFKDGISNRSGKFIDPIHYLKNVKQ
ncbi:glycosyltransferase family 2 protein [Robertmurraya sp. FSL R5-0851]|uniref:glycosyltransferase family 2 protein n=1 Tax=Robertmurraya sp. FSL R5-0851 TaxID=2921584 RepID=UPI0030FD0777